jgi:hypothetical protein
MRRGIDLLHESRIDIVVADVDALNSPVIAALQRSGWIESGGSWRFDLRTAEQER